MSRIGKQPIPVPDGVEISIEPDVVKVKGPKGELEERVSRQIGVAQENGEIVVTRSTDRGEHRALHGLTRSLIANMVEGVTNGYEKRLEIQGVGYRAQLQGKKLVLALGYSHPVEMDAPEGIDFEVPIPTRIAERPRLSVFRSNRGIQAQLIDDVQGHTVAAVNWVEADLKELARMEQAKKAGELLAERAKAAGVEECVFDRGGYQFHGKVKALADGAREGGLKF